MQLYRTLSTPSLRRGDAARAVAIGAFDGLHLGHQEILRRLEVDAARDDCRSLVCSFEPMPAEFFSPEAPPPRLTRFRERFEYLESLGIDEFFCPRFESVQGLSPGTFIEQLLVDALRARHVVVGHDFRFGTARRGTIDDLVAAGQQLGFAVTAVPPVYHDGIRVSSTMIRAALKRGDLGAAKAMLGRDYSMSGRVVRGLGLGKQLGFPTANVHLKRRQTPVDGIFAARVTGLDERPLDGVASVGSRPTVGGGEPLLEVFIFDFDREVYGRYISVHFIERLREERHYASLDALREQMRIDVHDARAALAA